MVDLERGERSVALAHLGEKGEGKDAVVAGEVKLALLVARLSDVDDRIADVDNGRSALGECSEEVDELRGHSPVAGG